MRPEIEIFDCPRQTDVVGAYVQRTVFFYDTLYTTSSKIRVGCVALW